MDFYKKDSKRYLDTNLRSALGIKRYETGMYLINILEEMVADDFDMSRWIKEIIKGLKSNSKNYKPAVSRTLAFDIYEGFLYLADTKRKDIAFECLSILQEQGYIKFFLDDRKNAITIELPRMLQSLTEWGTKQIWLNMKEGMLPFNIVKKLLSEEQREHYLLEISKMKDLINKKTGEIILAADVRKEIALNGNNTWKELVRCKADIEKDLELEKEQGKNIDVDSIESKNNDLDSHKEVDGEEEVFSSQNISENLQLRVVGDKYYMGDKEISREKYTQLTS